MNVLAEGQAAFMIDNRASQRKSSNGKILANAHILTQPLMPRSDSHLSHGVRSERLSSRNLFRSAGDTGQSVIAFGNQSKGMNVALTRGDTGGVIFSKNSLKEETN